MARWTDVTGAVVLAVQIRPDGTTGTVYEALTDRWKADRKARREAAKAVQKASRARAFDLRHRLTKTYGPNRGLQEVKRGQF